MAIELKGLTPRSSPHIPSKERTFCTLYPPWQGPTLRAMPAVILQLDDNYSIFSDEHNFILKLKADPKKTPRGDGKAKGATDQLPRPSFLFEMPEILPFFLLEESLVSFGIDKGIGAVIESRQSSDGFQHCPRHRNVAVLL